jgi:acetylcholinesterase
MVTAKGEQGDLFRGAWMNSGAPIPGICPPSVAISSQTNAMPFQLVGNIANNQQFFDAVSTSVGCTQSNTTLQMDCMREVPYNVLKSAINQTPGIFAYSSLNIAYLPLVDGNFLTQNPQELVALGEYSK